jgi:hypothetical protein
LESTSVIHKDINLTRIPGIWNADYLPASDQAASDQAEARPIRWCFAIARTSGNERPIPMLVSDVKRYTRISV